MQFSILMRSLIALLLLAGPARAFGAGDFHLIFTADTQGHVGPCQTCPGESGLGGLARRATLLTELRKREKPLLLLDAGNAFFGDQSFSSGGKVIAAAYDSLNYDAVNISYRDFRLGKAATLSALKDAKFSAVSCNLLDAQTHQPLFQPYVLKTVGNSKVAAIGATEVPAAMDVLAHLKQELAGVTIQSPVDALAPVLTKARAEAATVVLLYYGSASSAKPIADRFGKQIDVILLGGTRPDEISEGSAPALAATAPHGRAVGDVHVQSGTSPAITQWSIVPALKPDPQVQKVIAMYVKDPGVLTLAIPPEAQNATSVPGKSMAPAAIQVGKTERLNASARNRAIELQVKTIALLDKLGDTEAPAGQHFLVVETSFRNLQKARKVNDEMVPVQYKVPNLADNLYCVSGARVLPRSDGDFPHLLSFGELSLEKENEMIEGTIVYVVTGSIADATLRFYDFNKGNIAIPLVGTPAEQKPIVGPQKNQAVEAGIFALKKVKEIGEDKAPQGLTFVQIELRARSTIVTANDATSFDPDAKAGQKLMVGTVADWKESRKYAQLLIDGEYTRLPLDKSDLIEEPRFLPDVMTGGSLVFLAPEKCQSIELRCDFPNAELPDGKVVRGDPLLFALEGKRPGLPARTPIVTAKDEIFEVTVTRQEVADSFAGVKADEGQRFLILDVTAKNAGGKQQEFFQPKDQLKFVAADASQAEMDEVTYQGIHPPAELIYIPAKEQRSFQAVYKIAETEKRPRLAYAAVTEGASKVLTLKPLP